VPHGIGAPLRSTTSRPSGNVSAITAPSIAAAPSKPIIVTSERANIILVGPFAALPNRILATSSELF
jgi:hypothetical protein